MSKRVLDVGQCGPDHSTICSYLTRNFKCEVVQAHGLEDTLQHLKSGEFHLVLVNRKLDVDYSDGIEIIRRIKSDDTMADVPVMLVTNYPEHQEAAIAAGAIQGFGKLEYHNPETLDKLKTVLSD